MFFFAETQLFPLEQQQYPLALKYMAFSTVI